MIINRTDIYKIRRIRKGDCQKDYKLFRNSTIEEKGQHRIWRKMVNIGFIKMGNLGMSQVINLIQDEIAAREGITVRSFGTGAKMGPAEAADTESFKQWNADFVVIISPNAAAPGPTAARELWKDVPCIVVSDGPTKKEAREAFEQDGFGYIHPSGRPPYRSKEGIPRLRRDGVLQF